MYSNFNILLLKCMVGLITPSILLTTHIHHKKTYYNFVVYTLIFISSQLFHFPTHPHMSLIAIATSPQIYQHLSVTNNHNQQDSREQTPENI